MTINVKNYDATQNYIIPETKDLRTWNLLVNGDFQCNQRKKNSYVIGTGDKGAIVNQYTLDMWAASSYITVNYIDNKKVQIKNSDANTWHTFFQKIKLTAKEYTLVVKCNIVSGNANVCSVNDSSNYKQRMTLQTGINKISFLSDGYNDVVFRVGANSTIEIEYVDIYEGNVAHTHVKEDYSIAWYRCQSYLMVFTGSNAWAGGSYSVDTWAGTGRIEYSFPAHFVESPTLTSNLVSSMYVFSGINGEQPITKVQLGWVTRPYNIVIQFLGASNMSRDCIGGSTWTKTPKDDGHITLSCEPL